MSGLRHRFFSTEVLRRLGAGSAGALVLFLSVLTASPELHQLIHGHNDAGPEDACAVVQFASGVSIAADTAVVAVGLAVWQLASRPAPAEILFASPCFLHPPERGPPTS